MSEDRSEENLKALMLTGLRIQREVETSPKPQNELQDRIQLGILILEDTTRLVSLLDIFSENEVKDEVITEYLPFLLLPALLGNLTTRISSEDRLNVLKTASTYYEDFLQRAFSFEIIDFKAPKINEDEKVKPQNSGGRPNLSASNAEREDKIRKYKEKKAIEDELEDLHAGVLSSAQRDEDALRKYYLSLIHRFALLSLEELNSFKSEMEILRFMAKNKRSLPQASSEPPPKKPFKPIIITRDEAQKRVFGLGYSSVPIYSVEEFYEQRVRDGWFPSPEEVAVANENSLKDEASNPERALQMAEAEDEESENAIERDDEDKLIRMRAMDDYKDTHKRGEGNRYNMG